MDALVTKTWDELRKATEQAFRIYFEILDLWSDVTDGLWRWEDKVYLETPEDTYEYDTLAEAAKDCLCTIKERFKEV